MLTSPAVPQFFETLEPLPRGMGGTSADPATGARDRFDVATAALVASAISILVLIALARRVRRNQPRVVTIQSTAVAPDTLDAIDADASLTPTLPQQR